MNFSDSSHNLIIRWNSSTGVSVISHICKIQRRVQDYNILGVTQVLGSGIRPGLHPIDFMIHSLLESYMSSIGAFKVFRVFS